ncbi:MAG: hypothetical protein NWE83_04660 [Candidatus Bathyarchaeota archaeon]|nr:hypothetical protein [Candidatus Bathyarchaeota archaeon]
MVRRINLDLKRYVGDKGQHIVHDCDHEQSSDCRIDGIVATHNAVTFAPDTFEQAEKEGYSACPYCSKI